MSKTIKRSRQKSSIKIDGFKVGDLITGLPNNGYTHTNSSSTCKVLYIRKEILRHDERQVINKKVIKEGIVTNRTYIDNGTGNMLVEHKSLKRCFWVKSKYFTKIKKKK